MSDTRPVDLAAPQLQACRWAVVWWVDGKRQETTLPDQALADAYAAKQHGVKVALANLTPWPTGPK